jgi:hypothetical protein
MLVCYHYNNNSPEPVMDGPIKTLSRIYRNILYYFNEIIAIYVLLFVVYQKRITKAVAILFPESLMRALSLPTQPT